MACLMDADAKRPGGGVGLIRTMVNGGRQVKNRQNLADVFFGWPLNELCNMFAYFMNFREVAMTTLTTSAALLVFKLMRYTKST